MLAFERARRLREVVWHADSNGNPGKRRLIVYIECWKYGGLEDTRIGVNQWREGYLENVDGDEGQLDSGHEQIGMWVRHEVRRAKSNSF
jgi:hypothetical protein